MCEEKNEFIGLIINKLFHNIKNNQIVINDEKIFGSIILSKLYYSECKKEKLYDIIPHYYFIPCFSFDNNCKPIKKSYANKKEFLKYNKNIKKSLFYIYFNYMRYILKSSLIFFIIFFLYFILNNIN